MNRQQERAVEALIKVARPLMLRGVGEWAFKPDSCIAACRIGSLALAHFNVQAQTIGISYIVLNAAYRQQVAESGAMPESADDLSEDAYSMGLGVTWEDDPDDVGHFALAIGARLMVDLTADQMTRRAKGIVFDEPVVGRMAPGWRSSGERTWTHTDTYSLGIQAEPGNKAFLGSRDWTLRKRYQPFVKATVAAMREHLAR